MRSGENGEAGRGQAGRGDGRKAKGAGKRRDSQGGAEGRLERVRKVRNGGMESGKEKGRRK